MSDQEQPLSVLAEIIPLQVQLQMAIDAGEMDVVAAIAGLLEDKISDLGIALDRPGAKAQVVLITEFDEITGGSWPSTVDVVVDNEGELTPFKEWLNSR